MSIDIENVVIIGPVLPYRGGIAQHTTMLARSISGLVDKSVTLSFSRQYPSWLFPGESDKDPTYQNHIESDTQYIIDSMNPLTWNHCVSEISNLNTQLVLIPWWTVFWAPCLGFIAKRLQAKGIKVVFFCHNVVEHEAALWKNILTKWVLKSGSQFVVHTKEDQSNLLNLLPNARVRVHPHPIYDHFPVSKGNLKRRASLELLYYGFVRPYKGVDDLIDAMSRLKGLDIHLTIAGEFWKGLDDTKEKIKSLGLNDQIELRPQYHSDEETADLFERADAVVLPYKSATGSGVIPIAYHYNTPVVVTRVGGLPDVVEEGKTGWVIEPHNSIYLSDVLSSLTSEQCHACADSIETYKLKFSWDSLAASVLDD